MSSQGLRAGALKRPHMVEVPETSAPKRASRPKSASLPRANPVPPDETAARAQHTTPELKLEEFSPGQILAVDLTNFQVCVRGSYRFRPWLNLIVGPNGSGKSTVITALFLLLNGDRKDTARQNTDDFIRIGCKMARATTWILGPDRRLKKISMLLEQKKPPVYEINDKAVRMDDIEALNACLNIQVNNRCQFLPQERVASFSAESSHQRLISTLQSVGESDMVNVLEELIQIGEKVRSESESAGQNVGEIDTLTAERDKLGESVERLRQTYQEKKELELLRSVNLLAKYREAKEAFRDANTQLESSKAQEREFRQTNQSFFDAKDEYTSLLESYSSKRAEISTDGADIARNIDRVLAAIKAESLHSTLSDVEALECEKEQSDSNIRSIKAKIKSKNQELQGFRDALDPEALLEAETKIAQLRREIGVLETQKEELVRTSSSKEHQLNAIQLRRQTLSVAKNKASEERLELFQGKAPVIKKACKLISENKHIFGSKVHPPPVLTMKVRPGADAQVNAMLPLTNLDFFVCESDADFRKVSKLFDENNVNIRIVTSTANYTPDAALRSQLIDLGFDGVISDLIDDHPKILNYLVASEHLDTIPYTSSRPLSASAEAAVRNLPRFPVRRYLTSTHIVRLNKSRYGNKQTSETRTKLKNNYQWVQRLRQSPRELAESQDREVKDLEDQMRSIRTEIDEKSALLGEVDAQRLEKLQERSPFSNVVKKQKTLQHMIEEGARFVANAEKELERANTAKASYVDREIALAKSFANKFKISSGREVSRQAERIVPHAFKVGISRAIKAECRSTIHRLENEIEGQLGHIRNLIEQLTRTCQTARARMEDFSPQIAELKDRLGPEGYSEARQRAIEMSSEEVERAVANLEASLALNEDGQTYEEALRLLEQITARLETLVNKRAEATTRLSEAQEQLNTVAPEFEAKSRQFVEGISAKYFEFFARLGCTGHVELVAPPLSFENWGIEVKVSFRNGEPVRALSAKTQSGGEKAVATAVYLMALQGYSKAPFFVVDEINQGMDKLNERAIHKFIVETACIYNPRQYFMVTPKLLPDLTYHPRMKILCHNSSVNVK